MKEIRDIKIDLVMGNKNPIVDLFRELTTDIKIMNCNVYNEEGMEFIYYNKDNEWIFYQDVKKGKFWCEYNRYWSLFGIKLQLNYNEIKEITKLLVEENLKREIGTPDRGLSKEMLRVEQELKRNL
jgi:hypothetical protein